jgi:hypothetical protein
MQIRVVYVLYVSIYVCKSAYYTYANTRIMRIRTRFWNTPAATLADAALLP